MEKDFSSIFSKKPKIKVCGMRHADNINAIAALNPDFLGFIFYAPSPRFVQDMDPKVLQQLSPKIMKIGVFVNETAENILETVKKYSLNGVQLHGNETPDFCYNFRSAGLLVLKAFQIAEASDFKIMEHYSDTCDYYVFDTKTEAYGGSGRKFDWTLLDKYRHETPFLLSGGLSKDDANEILEIKHPQFAGVDINSKFEISPGLKNADWVSAFVAEIRK